ncbi:MAG: aromatic ring-hydroxylating dioxygenase subunit alpha [Paracoccaceae bacterium]|nr:aromatic ring-hydroxylating dioxygenase subunit alpha [Paracoccaceae bacterium]
MLKIAELDFSNCILPADQASSLPPSCYTSEDVTNAEIEHIFRKSWIGVGRADILASAGDYITLDIAGQNIILLRDKKGSLRAFANVCRHRNARLVDGKGACKGIRCPFHSWFYGLDGQLIAAPNMEKVKGFDKSKNRLLAYRAEERQGFAFVCLDPETNSIDDFLGNFNDVHAPWPISSLVSVRRRETVVDCNWKMFLEVFNEYYHLPFVHPDTVDSIYLAPNAAEKVNGTFATQFGPTEGTGGLLEDTQESALPTMPRLTGESANGARYTWVFPNMTFAANSDALWCYEAYPISANQCKVYQTACFPPETVAMQTFAEKSLAYLERLDAALAEDVPALTNQQRGMTCPDALPGRFQPDLEPNVAAFARWYASQWK